VVKGEFRFRFLGYLLWFVGFLILVLIMNRLHTSAEHMVATNLTITPQVWADTFIAIVFGAYLSILSVKRWTLSVNRSLLLWVTFPCAAVALYFPIGFSFTWQIPFHLPLFVSDLNYGDFASIVTGFTLMRGLFSVS
jgi:hypothetical protein